MLHQVALTPAGYRRPAGKSDKLTSDCDYNNNNNNPTGGSLTFDHQRQMAARRHETAETAGGTVAVAAAETKVKRLELSVRRLVEASAELADSDQTLSLGKAREALASLDSLRVLVAKEEQQQVGANEVDDNQINKIRNPATTSVHLLELTVMVRGNLAERLVANGKFDEAIEIYTQLSKLAPNTNVDLAPSSSVSESQKPPGSTSRYLLHRFGLNIGNVHFKQRNFTKALKYYRLTLDRMASVQGHRQLKVKLMANISVVLMELSNLMQINVNPPQAGDVITAFNLLLADNLQPTNASESIGRQQNHQVVNANHHKFGLNLMCCHFQRSDLRSMFAVLKELVKVDICAHYDASTHASLDRDLGATTGSDNVIIGSSLSTGSEDDPLQLVINRRKGEISRSIVVSCNLMLDLEQRRAAGGESRASTSARDLCLELLRTSNRYKSLSGDLEANKLGALLRKGNKLNEAIKLLTGTETSGQSRSARATGVGSSPMPMGGTSSSSSSQPGKTHGKSRSVDQPSDGSGSLSDIQSSLSATNLCLFKLLSGDHELAIDLGQLALQIDKRNQFAWVNLANCHLLKALASATTNTTDSKLTSSTIAELTVAESCYLRALLLDATCWQANYNLALVSRLQQQHHHHHQLQVGGREINRSPMTAASKSYGQTTRVATNPPLGRLNGNEMVDGGGGGDGQAQQVGNIVKRQSQQLAESLVAGHGNGASGSGNLRLLAYQRLILAPLQFALFMLRVDDDRASETTSGYKKQKAASIINELIASAKQAPEVHLLASRVGGGGGNPADGGSKYKDSTERTQIVARLKLANKDYPYHLPLSERIVALLIDSFNYREATELLLDCCLRLRPDQLRWYQLLAECHRRAAEYKEAIAIYRSVIELFPRESAACIRSLGKLADELGIVELQSWTRERLDRLQRVGGT